MQSILTIDDPQWTVIVKLNVLPLCPVERDGQWDEGVFFLLVQPLNTGQTRGLSNTMTSDKMPAKFSL